MILKELLNEVGTWKTEYKKLQSKAKEQGDLEILLTERERRIIAQHNEIKELERQLNDLEVVLQEREKKVSFLEDQLQEANEHNDCERKIREKESRISFLDEQIKRVSDHSKCETRINEKEAEANELRIKASRLEVIVREISHDLESNKAIRELRSQELEDLTKENSRIGKLNKEKEAEISSLKQKIRGFEKTLEDLTTVKITK